MFNRLPVDHPDYKYPPSPNPYWTKLRGYTGIVYNDNETEGHSGRWRTIFGAPESAELNLEIGCNAGHVVIEWARRSPGALYLGMDWKFKMIAKGADKALKHGLKNLKFLRSYAERIPYVFAPSEVDRLYLFFPDPWPKRAQQKNRFLTAERLRKLASVVRPGGSFEIRTDHRDYFAQMREAIEGAKGEWKLEELSENFHEPAGPAALKLEIPDVTLFEKIFIKQGIPIRRALLVRQ